MVTLDTLPLDIFMYLMEMLEPKEIGSLRLVNKSLKSATDVTFWRSQTFVLKLIRQPMGVVSRKELMLQQVRRLEEFRENRASAGRIQRIVIEVESLRLHDSREKQPTAATLSEVLCSLQNLRSVRWMLIGDGPTQNLKQTIIQSLASLPLLSAICIYTDFDMTERPLAPLNLGLFRNGKIKVLEIFGHFNDQREYFSSLSTLLVHNPNIAELNIDAPYSILSEMRLQIDDVFSALSPVVLKLKHLSLHGPWLLTGEVASHLRVLSSISLYSRFSDPTLWDALRVQNVHIQDISLRTIDQKFLDYLSSFSGLKSLNLTLIHMANQMTERKVRMAHDFFERALPMHASTIQRVHISSFKLRDWGLQTWQINAYASCTQLRTLEIEIYDELFQTQDPNQHILFALIQRVAHLPNLQVLTITRDDDDEKDRVAFMGRIICNIKLALTELPKFQILVEVRLRTKTSYLPEMVRPGEVIFRKQATLVFDAFYSLDSAE